MKLSNLVESSNEWHFKAHAPDAVWDAIEQIGISDMGKILAICNILRRTERYEDVEQWILSSNNYQLIAKYVSEVLGHQRWLEAEPIMSITVDGAEAYAEAINSNFPKGEPVICRHEQSLRNYIRYSMSDRSSYIENLINQGKISINNVCVYMERNKNKAFPKFEQILIERIKNHQVLMTDIITYALNTKSTEKYATPDGGHEWPEVEHYIVTTYDVDDCLRYCTQYKEDRWFELEERLSKLPADNENRQYYLNHIHNFLSSKK